MLKWLLRSNASRHDLEAYFGTDDNVWFLKRLTFTSASPLTLGVQQQFESLLQATPNKCRTPFVSVAVALMWHQKWCVPDSVLFGPDVNAAFVLHECLSYNEFAPNHGRTVRDTNLRAPLAALIRTGRLAAADIVRESSFSSAHLLPSVLKWYRCDAPATVHMIKNVAARADFPSVRRLMAYADDNVLALLQQDGLHWSAWALGLLDDDRVMFDTADELAAVVRTMHVNVWHPAVMTGTAVRAKCTAALVRTNSGVLSWLVGHAFKNANEAFLDDFFGPCLRNLAEGRTCQPVPGCPCALNEWQGDALADVAHCPARYRRVLVNCLRDLPRDARSIDGFCWWYRKLMQRRLVWRRQLWDDQRGMDMRLLAMVRPHVQKGADAEMTSMFCAMNTRLRWSIVRAQWVARAVQTVT